MNKEKEAVEERSTIRPECFWYRNDFSDKTVVWASFGIARKDFRAGVLVRKAGIVLQLDSGWSDKPIKEWYRFTVGVNLSTYKSEEPWQ